MGCKNERKRLFKSNNFTCKKYKRKKYIHLLITLRGYIFKLAKNEQIEFKLIGIEHFCTFRKTIYKRGEISFLIL